MKVQGLFAAMCVKNISSSADFYAKFLGRKPDDKPMDTLVQWCGFGSAGIQLFQDPERAGKSRMTIVVADLINTKSLLNAENIELGEIQHGNFGKIAQLTDPDGNLITLAEPPKE